MLSTTMDDSSKDVSTSTLDATRSLNTESQKRALVKNSKSPRASRSTSKRVSRSSKNSKRVVELRAPDEFPHDYYGPDEVRHIRRKISEKLAGRARYVELKSGTKIAVGNFSDENTSEVIPDSGDYGVIPKKNLFIIDIDSHDDSGITVDSQIDIFSELLGVELRNTLAVSTPGGGFHAYVLAPEDATNLNDGLQNLNGYSKAISHILGRNVIVDADIRTGKTSGYTVGPTSVSLTVVPASSDRSAQRILGFYRIADEDHGFSPLSNDADLLYMSQEGFERFSRLKEVKKSLADAEISARRLAKSAKEITSRLESSRLEEVSREILDASSARKLESLPPSDLLRKLEKEMISRNMSTFHQKRSFVKSALHCCHSDQAIAEVCIDFQIDRDSSTRESISYKSLIIDLQRFTPSARFHGGYCSVSQKSQRAIRHKISREADQAAEAIKPFDLEAFRAENAQKVAQRKVARFEFGYRGSITPKVLDTSAISAKLLEGSRRKGASQQCVDAMAIVDYFLQPLSNVGSGVILLARSAVEERLEISSSRASQALRILRERDIISVSSKQKTGLAATYSVNDEFTHVRLTKTLRMLWGFNGVHLETGELNPDGTLKKFHANLYLDRSTGTFREVFTEKIVESNFPLVSKWIQSMNEKTSISSASKYGSGAALSYLKSEAKVRGLTAIGGPTTVVIEDKTGEIVEPSAISHLELLQKDYNYYLNSAAVVSEGLRPVEPILQLEMTDPP